MRELGKKIMRKILIILISLVVLAIIVWVGWFRYGTLEVNANAASIDIKINKKEYKAIKIPARFRLKAGEYTIKAGVGNFEEFEDKVSIKAREVSSITVEVEGEEDIRATEEFYKKNPLVNLLPTSNNHFKIDYYQEGTADIKYDVILYSVSTPSQPNYLDELKQYKREALDWIKNNGVDPSTLEIRWTPKEAETL